MPYFIQGDEIDIGLEKLQQLAAVMAESPELVPADALYRLKSGHGLLRFEDRLEAERVAARFDELGVTGFVVDELLPLPRVRRLGPGAPLPEEAMGLVALARVEKETKVPLPEVTPGNVRFSYEGIKGPILDVDQPPTVRRETHLMLDFFTREQHWFVKTGAEARAVEVFLQLNVAEARLNEGVRSLAHNDQRIPLFHDDKDHTRYLTWLYQLRYA